MPPSLIRHDLHLHTYLSACCSDKENHRPERILAKAEELGLETVGFADHVWQNPGLEPSDWYRPQDARQIERLREDLSGISTPVRVLVGCEAEMIAPGKFGIAPEFAEQLDFILLACSHLHMREFVAQPKSDGPRDIAEHLLLLFRGAVESGLATAIPHPFLPCGHTEKLDQIIASTSDRELEDAFGIAADRSVAIEVSAPMWRLKDEIDGLCSSGESLLRLLSIAKRAGCKFTFASDAHCLDEVVRVLSIAPCVEAIGLSENDILRI